MALSSVGLGAMIAAVIGVPATAYVLAPVTDKATFNPVLLGEMNQFTGEKAFAPTAVTYIEDTNQPVTSAALAYVHYTGKNGTTWNANDAMFIVFSNRCTHVGCPALAVPAVGFQCPCHGSAFNQIGQRVAGPAIRPLDRFQWEIKNTTELWITQRWSVDFNSDGQIHYYDAKSPGQPLTLPVLGATGANVLYPRLTYTYPSGSNPNRTN